MPPASSSGQNKRVRGVSVWRPIIYGNTAVLLEPHERDNTDHTHRWTVAVRSANSPVVPSKSEAHHVGGGDDISYFIKKVTFKLHESFPQPLRTLEKPPFEVTETGWGEFDIMIKLFFVAESSEKPLTLTHHLKLHPWPAPLPPPPPPPAPSAGLGPPGVAATPAAAGQDSKAAEANGSGAGSRDAATPAAAASTAEGAGTSSSEAMEVDPVEPEGPPLILSPIHSWQYEEVVFSEPTESFYALLLSKPPTGLPKTNRHPKTLTYALGGGGNVGEFTLEMEDQEGQRLEEARRKALEEIEALRNRLIGDEKELGGLKKEVEDLTSAAAAAAAASATPVS